MGLGIGGRLLDTMLSECVGAGVRQVIAVIVDSDGAASLALHRNRGFVEVGRLSALGLKHGQWLDTLRPQRSQSQTDFRPRWVVVSMVGGVAAFAVQTHVGNGRVIEVALKHRNHPATW